MKQTEENTNKWKDIPHSWIERINIVKLFILSKASYRFNLTSIKIPMAFFTEIIVFKICMETQKTSNRRSKFNNDKAGSITLSYFKLYYKAVVIKTMWYLHQKDT